MNQSQSNSKSSSKFALSAIALKTAIVSALIAQSATSWSAGTTGASGASGASSPTGAAQPVAPIDVPSKGKVLILEPTNGSTVPTKFKVRMGAEQVEIKPAGALAKGSGHHHLIIDGASIPVGQLIPADDRHLHFGKGQTETEVTLKPGQHTLTLQLADGIHRSYGEKFSSTIVVTVK